jgi:hypothetical protein
MLLGGFGSGRLLAPAGTAPTAADVQKELAGAYSGIIMAEKRAFPDTGILNFALGIEEVTMKKREYAQREFPDTGILNFALGFEEVTMKKRGMRSGGSLTLAS